MGYRGEDTPRLPAAWGEQPPRRPAAGTGAGSWGDGPQGQWQDDHAAEPGYEEYPGNDEYAGYGQHGYDDYGSGAQATYGAPTGYPEAQQQGPGYGTATGYGQQEDYGQPDGLDYQQSGGYSGNDWYNHQPDAASGSGFADTGTYSLNSRIIDEYGSGPQHNAGYGQDDYAGYGQDDNAGYGQDQYAGYGTDDYAGYGPDDYADDGGRGYGQESQDGSLGGYVDYAESGGYPGQYDGAGQQPGGRSGRPGRGGRPRQGGRGRRPLLLGGLAAIALVLAATAAYKFWLNSPAESNAAQAQQPLPTTGPAASTPACVAQFGTYCHIELRSDDPMPLTLAEIFPPAFQNVQDHAGFRLTATKLDKTCSSAVIGQDLINALDKGKCTQLVRASYVSADGKIMGTIGVANLATTHGAHAAGKLVGQSDFVAPLAASKGVASKLGQGTGVVQAEFKGHYLILTWAEYVDGTTPAKATQAQQLEQWEADLVAGTANVSLSQRMVSGAPASPGAAA
jgi:hypothetical protein